MVEKDHSAERRRFSRISLDFPVTLTCDGLPFSSQLLDISLKGALIERPKRLNLPVGTACTLAIHLGRGSGDIRMQGEICHSGNGHLGFLYHHIDLGSAGHLKRIVELNLGNTLLLERELSELSAG